MAASDIVDTWTVVVDCDEEDKTAAYKMANTTTVGKTKEKWARSANKSPDSFVLVTMAGAVAQDTQRLVDVGEEVPGRKTVTFRVEAGGAVPVYVELYGGSGERVQVFARLSEPAEDLEAAVRQAFPLASGRHLRLRCGLTPLTPGVVVGAQGVAAGSVLAAELMHEVGVKETWSDQLEQLLLFGSDPCDLLLEVATAAPQRLMCGRYVVDGGQDVLAALLPFGALQLAHVQLCREVQRSLVVATGECLLERLVWPLERVSSVVPGRSAAPRSAMFCDVMAWTSSRLCVLDMPEHGLLHCDPVAVRVRTSDQCVRVVRVPALGTVADVVEAVRRYEIAQHFVLAARGRELESDEAIADVGTATGIVWTVEPTGGKTVTVTLADRSVRWQCHKQQLTFSGVMKEVSMRGRISYDDLLCRTLCCVGCGRRVHKAEEVWQPIPAPCCHVRSLELAEPTSRECQTQTAVESRRRVHRGVEKRPETVESKTQVATKSRRRVHRSVEKRPETVERGVQTGSRQWDNWTQMKVTSTATTGAQATQTRSALAQQQPPPPPPPPPLEPRPFLVRDRTQEWRDIPCDLLLPAGATVGQVRAAVAQTLGRNPEELELRRWVESEGTMIFFLVCSEDGSLPDSARDQEVGDKDGRLRRRRPPISVWATLPDDGVDFPLVGGRRNVIAAIPR